MSGEEDQERQQEECSKVSFLLFLRSLAFFIVGLWTAANFSFIVTQPAYDHVPGA